MGRDHARRFPEVARAVAALPGRDLVVDGEVAVFDTELVSRFEYLTVPPLPDAVIMPPVYIAFDVLLVRGRDLRARPLRDRWRTLEDLVDGSEVFPVRRLPDDGRKAWEIVQARGYEGLVAKDDARTVPVGADEAMAQGQDAGPAAPTRLVARLDLVPQASLNRRGGSHNPRAMDKYSLL
jgi:ATP-dependent DNA ligase